MYSETYEEPGCSRTHVCSTGDLGQGSCPQEVAFRHGDPVPISGDPTRNQHGLDNAGSTWGPPQSPALAVLEGDVGIPPSPPCLPHLQDGGARV